MTMAYFTKCGLIQIDEDKNSGLPQAKAMVMSETNWASYKREQRNSLGQFELSDNGGIALAQIAGHYLGTAGNVLLALIVFFGCFKTAVGLLTAFAETFAELFPSVSYKTFLAVATIFPALFANVGLTNIIAYSIPVLMFIYPLAIVLVLLGLCDKLLAGRQGIDFRVTAFTLLPATLDGLAASP